MKLIRTELFFDMVKLKEKLTEIMTKYSSENLL